MKNYNLKKYDDYNKIIKIIESCETEAHLKVAKAVMMNFLSEYKRSETISLYRNLVKVFRGHKEKIKLIKFVRGVNYV